ncbi:hypothetical protein Tco_1504496 [Tanacetum coccineum]
MVISSPCLTDIKNWLVQSKWLLSAGFLVEHWLIPFEKGSVRTDEWLVGIIAEGFGIVKGVAHGVAHRVADNVPVFKRKITHLTKNDANKVFVRFNSLKSVTSIDNKVTKTTEEYALKRTGEYLAEMFFGQEDHIFNGNNSSRNLKTRTRVGNDLLLD